MKTQRPGAGIFRAVALRDGFVPDAASRAILGNLLEEIAVRVEEKGKLRRKIVNLHAATQSPFDILHAVPQCEGEFLYSGRTSFANVVAADGNRIELGRVLDGELEGIYDKAHGRFGRVDIFLLRDVFLEDVVLQGTGDLFPVGALFFGDREVHRPNDRSGGINGQRGGYMGEGNLIEEN